MSNWQEIERIRKDARRCRTLARDLLKVFTSESFSDWETHFLEDVIARGDDYEFTTRQVEKLVEVRDGLVSLDRIRSFSVALLIKGVYEARLDLSEDDERWIEQVWATNRTTIRRMHSGRLFACAQTLGIIDRDAA
jgi:hypothetical protein